MKTNKFIAVLIALAAFLPSFCLAQNENEKDTLLRANTDTLMKHVRILSSSKYEGRIAGSDAYMEAADYVTEALERYGVKPYQGDWQQMFEVEYNEIENCTFNTYVNDNDTRTAYVLGRDFVCASMTGRGYIDGQVVFCGYGIDNRVFNEYAKIDARGKIVLCLSGTPNFLPSSITNSYATIRDKARVAQKHGAIGLIVINVSESCHTYEVQLQNYCGEKPYLPTFPMVQPTYDMGAALMANETMTLDSAIACLKEQQKPQSFHLRKKCEINVNAKYHPRATTCNIVGMLKGHDNSMKNEIIVVGAHLDHVGKQGKTCIFPGADDNASGVAAVLECARLLSQEAPELTKRSVVFAFFSGAELQHLGASIFVSNFKPLNKVEAFVNAECIGAGDSIMVNGNQRFPLLWNIASHNDSISTKSMVRGIKTAAKGDAAPFVQVGIPSAVFTHYHGNHNAHVPSDISENIEREIFTLNASLMAETVYELTTGEYQGRSAKSKRFQFAD